MPQNSSFKKERAGAAEAQRLFEKAGLGSNGVVAEEPIPEVSTDRSNPLGERADRVAAIRAKMRDAIETGRGANFLENEENLIASDTSLQDLREKMDQSAANRVSKNQKAAARSKADLKRQKETSDALEKSRQAISDKETSDILKRERAGAEETQSKHGAEIAPVQAQIDKIGEEIASLKKRGFKESDPEFASAVKRLNKLKNKILGIKTGQGKE